MAKLNSHIESFFLNCLTSLLSPAGKNARLSVVIYHRVQTEPDILLGDNGDVKIFDLHLNYLTSHFNVLPLYEAVERLHHGTLPSRAACITFDDGYADNAEIALPILKKYQIPATFFIAAGFIDGGLMWNDKVIELVRRAPGEYLDLRQIGLGCFKISSLQERQKALFLLLDKLKYQTFETRKRNVERLCQLIPVVLPDNLMMTSEQIKTLYASGMEIGGHTLNHPILARVEKDVAYSEIAGGKEILESLIGVPIRLFAYPNGKPGLDYLPEHIDMIKKIGFKAAVSTAWGAAKNSSDPYQLPRFTPWDRSRLRFVLRMARNMLMTAKAI